MNLENAEVMKRSVDGLAVGCAQGYGFSDGSRSKTIPMEQPCQTTTNWTEAVKTNASCYRKFFCFLYCHIVSKISVRGCYGKNDIPG